MGHGVAHLGPFLTLHSLWRQPVAEVPSVEGEAEVVVLVVTHDGRGTEPAAERIAVIAQIKEGLTISAVPANAVVAVGQLDMAIAVPSQGTITR